MSESKLYMVSWDAGFGTSTIFEEHNNLDEAEEQARQEWKEEVHSNASYEAQEATAEDLEEHGYDPQDYGMERTDPEMWDD